MISSNTKGPSLANQSESIPLCLDVDADMSIVVESTILSGRDTTFLISVNYDRQLGVDFVLLLSQQEEQERQQNLPEER